jgi:hypothetical protein
MMNMPMNCVGNTAFKSEITQYLGGAETPMFWLNDKYNKTTSTLKTNLNYLQPIRLLPPTSKFVKCNANIHFQHKINIIIYKKFSI